MTQQRTQASPWWTPKVHADRRPFLLGRNAIQAAVRGHFAGLDFIEVDTATLQISPGNESHLHAFVTEAIGHDGKRQPLYLHTSPEFAMKKLLVAGMPRIFQFAHVWRDGERSATHHPEFTMLEWYRAGAGYEALMEDCAVIMASAARAVPVGELRRGDRRCDPFSTPRKLTVAQAFFDYCDIDLLASIDDPTRPDARVLAAAARGCGLHVGETDSWEDVFFRVMIERIEPFLGDGVPLILHDYPVPLAALSRPRPDDPRVAERFELYACGVELANGFGELTDAAEQRRRFVADMDLKERLYGVRYPLDEDFLAALELGLPDCAGIALGMDRLVMLATGSQTIDEVLWAPVAE